jgi:hypothetical protein
MLTVTRKENNMKAGQYSFLTRLAMGKEFMELTYQKPKLVVVNKCPFRTGTQSRAVINLLLSGEQVSVRSLQNSIHASEAGRRLRTVREWLQSIGVPLLEEWATDGKARYKRFHLDAEGINRTKAVIS